MDSLLHEQSEEYQDIPHEYVEEKRVIKYPKFWRLSFSAGHDQPKGCLIVLAFTANEARQKMLQHIHGKKGVNIRFPGAIPYKDFLETPVFGPGYSMENKLRRYRCLKHCVYNAYLTPIRSDYMLAITTE